MKVIRVMTTAVAVSSHEEFVAVVVGKNVVAVTVTAEHERATTTASIIKAINNQTKSKTCCSFE